MQKTVIIIGEEFYDDKQIYFLHKTLNTIPNIKIHKLSICNIEDTLSHLVMQLEDERPVLIAFGNAGATAWMVASKFKQLGALLIIHPQELPDFTHQYLEQTCLLIHQSSTNLTSVPILKTLQRPRPDIAQLIEDDLNKLINLIANFIKQFSGAKHENLGRVIQCAEISKGFPAPEPGAIPVFEDENCYIGAVRLDNHTPYEHINYRDEVHVVISGNGHFRHGNGELIKVKQGDIAYVKAFEKHRWSDWSSDFKLLFIQCGPNPLLK